VVCAGRRLGLLQWPAARQWSRRPGGSPVWLRVPVEASPTAGKSCCPGCTASISQRGAELGRPAGWDRRRPSGTRVLALRRRDGRL